MRDIQERPADGTLDDLDDGFTLIELLVVVVIIGILIAIAIPLYSNYKKGANDKAAESDLRAAISTLEQCNSEKGQYPAEMYYTGAISADYCDHSVVATPRTHYAYFIGPNGDTSTYLIESANDGGSGVVYCYVSNAGGSIVALSTPEIRRAYCDL